MTPKKVKAIRLKLGLTQVQFAKQLNYKQSTISKWESGAIKLGPRAKNAVGDLVLHIKARDIIQSWDNKDLVKTIAQKYNDDFMKNYGHLFKGENQ